MRAPLILLVCLFLIVRSQAAPGSALGRTIKELDVIPASVLQRAISPKFYQTILVSPIAGWVTVRGALSGTSLYGLRVVHSEPNGLNDHLALQRASEVRLAGGFTLENPNTRASVLVHLLLYKTADGVLAMSFAHLEGAGGDQMTYYGCTRMAVLKDNGRWVDIKGPTELDGKALVVQQKGLRNDYAATVLRLERIEVEK